MARTCELHRHKAGALLLTKVLTRVAVLALLHVPWLLGRGHALGAVHRAACLAQAQIGLLKC